MFQPSPTLLPVKKCVRKSLYLNVGQHNGVCSLENYCLLLSFTSSHFLQHQRVYYAILQHINPAIWLQSHSPRFTSFPQLRNCGLSFPQMPCSNLKICPCLYFAWNIKMVLTWGQRERVRITVLQKAAQ